jgi:hypothetical protein
VERRQRKTATYRRFPFTRYRSRRLFLNNLPGRGQQLPFFAWPGGQKVEDRLSSDVPDAPAEPLVPLAPLEGVVPMAAGLDVSDGDIMPDEDPDEDPIPEAESDIEPLPGAPLTVPEDDAPVVPDVTELLVVPAVPLVPLVPPEGVSAGEELAVPYDGTWPVADPVADPMPEADPEAEPEAPGPLPAHAARVKAAHVKGKIHFFVIQNSLVMANDFKISVCSLTACRVETSNKP